VSKRAAQIDLWLKEIAPSTALRRWFGHDLEKWREFRARYFRELRNNGAAVEQLMAHVRKGTVTLVYGAKDEEHNDAVALKAFLESEGQMPDACVDHDAIPRPPRVSGRNSTKTYGSENSASWRLEQAPVNTEDPVKTYPIPPCRRLLYCPGVLRDAQDISVQYFNGLR
jgi:uncharacterized protein YeaO (DUF488 family)